VIGWGIVDRGGLNYGPSLGNGLVVRGVKGNWMCLNDGVSEIQTLNINTHAQTRPLFDRLIIERID